MRSCLCLKSDMLVLLMKGQRRIWCYLFTWHLHRSCSSVGWSHTSHGLFVGLVFRVSSEELLSVWRWNVSSARTYVQRNLWMQWWKRRRPKSLRYINFQHIQTTTQFTIGLWESCAIVEHRRESGWPLIREYPHSSALRKFSSNFNAIFQFNFIFK